MTQVYHYDAQTGEYLGTDAALPDPMEAGKFLLPAQATFTAPPAVSAGRVAVFDAAKEVWATLADKRGTVFWLNGAQQTQEAPGPLPQGASLTAPQPTTAELWAQVRATRNHLLNQSDWTQLPDSPLSTAQKTAWAGYRQALRDITQQADPAAVVWPVVPRTQTKTVPRTQTKTVPD